MEIICIDKRTFDELVVRLSMIEKKVTGLCSPAKDAGLKKWMDNQEVCEVLRISKRTLQVYREKGSVAFHPDQEQDSSTSRKMCRSMLESSYHPQKRKP